MVWMPLAAFVIADAYTQENKETHHGDAQDIKDIEELLKEWKAKYAKHSLEKELAARKIRELEKELGRRSY